MASQTSLGTAWERCETHGNHLLSSADQAYRKAVGGGQASACDLAVLWQQILDGRLVFRNGGTHEGGHYVLCEVTQGGSPEPRLTRIESAVLVRVLCGEQQKSVALELQIACSTASKWHGNARQKLLIHEEPIPLPLVVAAQAWATGLTPAGARRSTVTSEGREHVAVTLPRVDTSRDCMLTRAERHVAELLIEGRSRWEIAERRRTSTQTVACQLRGIFAKMQVSGRCGLIRRAVEQGWLGGPFRDADGANVRTLT